MQALNNTVPDTPGSIQPLDLPDRTSNWPDAAASAFWDLLGELNAWSRECGESVVNNAWIAETAVRQSW